MKSQSFEGKTQTIKDIGIVTSRGFDYRSVNYNKKVKLEGTFGETIVIPHRPSSLLANAVSAFQKVLLDQFGEVNQNGEATDFIDEKGCTTNETGYAPIKNLHTTISALRVVDASDDTEWETPLIQSYLIAKLAQNKTSNVDKLKEVITNNNLDNILKLIPEETLRIILQIKPHINIREHIKNEVKFSPVTPEVETKLVNYIQTNPNLTLEIECLAMGPKGNIAIVWKSNKHMITLREELEKIGCVLKCEPKSISTTLGYFPNCTNNNFSEIHAALIKATKAFNRVLRENSANRFFPVNLNDINIVKFSRNDLHTDYSLMTRLIRDDRLSSEYHQVLFPARVQRMKDESNKLKISGLIM